jgi:proline iminopeptidase
LEGTTGDTIVVLHGGPGLNLETVRPDLAPLARRHHVLYFDQRGSGHSELPDSLQLTADAMVEDLEALRRTFRLERMTVLGHSWGGGLALLYAMRYPSRVSRLVLVGSLPLRGLPWGEQYFATQASRRTEAEQARMASLDSVIPSASDPLPPCREQMRLFLRGVTATPTMADRIRGDGCAATPENIRAHNQVNRLVFQSITTGLSETWDWRGQAASLTMPALVVHGREDPLPLASAEELAAALPNSRLVVIENAGHYPHAEQPEGFFPAVEKFLGGE